MNADDGTDSANSQSGGALKYIAGAVIVIVIVGVLLFGLHGNAGTNTGPSYTTTSGSGSGNLSIQLTDPPMVPAGTQSLIVTYSGVDLHETGTSNSTGFVNFSASGTINLMNLTNVSQTIAIIKTQAGESFNLIRFDLKTANITINNVTYNVTLATKGVVARINSSVNATSSSGVLLDFSPTVLQVYTSSNQSVFVLVPSAAAIAIGRQIAYGNIGTYLGAKTYLQGGFYTTLRAMRPNITITSASASEVGNVTVLHVTVVNNGNSSVLLSDLSLKGFFEAVPTYGIWNPPFGVMAGMEASPGTMRGGRIINSSANASLSSSASATGNLGGQSNVNSSTSASGSVQVSPRMWLNSSLNSSVASDLNVGPELHVGPGFVGIGAGATASQGVLLAIGEAEIFNRNFHNQLNFMVASNGTLELPYYTAFVSCPAIIVSGGNASASAWGCGNQQFGYALAPGASVTLSFDGVITMPNVGVVVSPNIGIAANGSAASSNWAVGPRVRSAVVVLIPNQTYSVAVHGKRRASASANVTATGYVSNFSSGLIDVTNVVLGLHNVASGTTYNETTFGFISHANSTVAYSVYSYGGPYVLVLPRLTSYGLNVTGFTVNTAGFTLVNYSTVVQPSPPCPACRPGVACPMYECIGGVGKIYLLNIKMPPTDYAGTLSITENYNALSAAANATAT